MHHSTHTTEVERYEQELHDSRGELRDAQRLGRLGSWIWDTDDDRVTMCEALLDIHGLEPGEFDETYESLIALVHPDDRARVDATVHRAVAEGVLAGFEYRIVRPDDSIRHVFAQGSVQRVEPERHRRLVGIAQDVTNLRQTEVESRRLALQNQAILESAGEGIVGIDGDGRTTFVNPAAARMVRGEAAALRGLPVQELLQPSHSDGTPYPRDECPVLAVLKDGQARTVDDEVFRTRDGRAFPVQYVSTPIEEDGEVVGSVLTFRDITDQKRVARQLQHLADHDWLTGLLNRRRFEQQLEQQVAVSARRGGGALLLLDLDDFKDVNDTLGHAAGDELLKSIAAALDRRARAGDTLARLGGDEFGVILPDGGRGEAETVAGKLMEVVRESGTSLEGVRQLTPTTSIGIALLEKGGELTAEELFMQADMALYDAKDAGGDRARLYSVGRRAQMQTRLTEAERIRRALRDDLFVLHGQPIVDLATGRAARHELLLRMRGDDDGELIAPGAFLPTAERLGLIVSIDRWVIGEAIRLVAQWRAAGVQLCVEVNLSARSLSEAALPSFIESELRSASVDPSQIIFEITETAAIANMDHACQFAASLTRLGCRFALDDFGAGFASYLYLKYLPVEGLKIDGDFVRNITRSKTDQLVVEAIARVANGLGKATIGECVEDAPTLEMLRGYGVGYAQGYHFARPAPLEELISAGRDGCED